MSSGTNSTTSNSLLEKFKQKVKDREREIEELTEMVEERDREISQLKTKLKGQDQGNNGVESESEDMDTTVNTEDFIPDIDPESPSINRGEADELRQEVVGSYS